MDEGGKVAAELPAHCPGCSPSDGCRVVARFRRSRGQGPAHPLVVAFCHEHGRSFTLYPPGWAPYGRRPTCVVTPAGYAVRSESVAGTMFAAAEDAEAGRLWLRSGAALDASVHRTQGRHLALASLLLGVCPSLAEAVREALAACLGVPLLVLHEARRRYEASRSWRARAGAVMAVVRRLGARRQLWQLWSAAGHIAGLWGRPSRWGPGGVLPTG